MATHTLSRRDYPELSGGQLMQKTQAFRMLFVDGLHDKAANSFDIIIKGEWPAAYDGDGLFLRYNAGGKVVAIGFEYVKIEWKEESTGIVSTIDLPLTPTSSTGFSEITFITMWKAEV